jgi:hypothetical protein
MPEVEIPGLPEIAPQPALNLPKKTTESTEFKMSALAFSVGAAFTLIAAFVPPLWPVAAASVATLATTGTALMTGATAGYAVSRGLAKLGK